MKKAMFACALASALALAGCSAADKEAVQNDEQTITDDTQKAAAAMDASTKEALDDFREEAQDLSDDILDFTATDVTEEDFYEAVNEFKEDYKKLYEGANSDFEKALTALKDHPELTEDLNKLKEETAKVYEIVSSDTFDAAQAAKMDTTAFMERMKQFDMDYFAANNLR